jgi:predicted DNA-binding transcriptional regulator YafY
VLPESVRRAANEVRETIKLPSTREEAIDEAERARVAKLREAILMRRKVSFGYSKVKLGAAVDGHSIRTARPYGLSFVYGSWVLVGFCELRQEIRHFRLSRMTELQDLEETFAFPPDFRLSKYVPADNRPIEVRVLASPRIADRVREAKYFYIVSKEEVPDGLLVVLRVRTPEDVLQWVLGWGSEAEVLEPEALRQRVRTEAERMLGRY